MRLLDALRAYGAELLFRLNAGPLCTLRWIIDRLLDPSRDKSFGIASLHLAEEPSGYANPDWMRYQGVSYADMYEILDGLDITPEDSFLDLGCGKGRAICVAAMYPFRRVLGVEVSPQLCSVARRNVERVSGEFLCGHVEVIEADAATYSLDPSITVVFLFNPFRDHLLSQVLSNIEASVSASPRDLRVLFCGTLSSRDFRRSAAQRASFSLVKETSLKTGARLLTYSIHPPDIRSPSSTL